MNWEDRLVICGCCSLLTKIKSKPKSKIKGFTTDSTDRHGFHG